MKRPLTPRELRIVIESIHLKRFKNFQDATLKLGPLTILIGANAVGKSNLRDAFLFLHGIGRGYKLADILGESYAGGERVWSGTRGGVREVAYAGSDSFELSVDMRLTKEYGALSPVKYQIRVSVAESAIRAPRIVEESLNYPHVVGLRLYAKGETGFRTNGREESGTDRLSVSLLPQRGTRRKTPISCPANQPILSQVSEYDEKSGREPRALSRSVLHELREFRFLDLSPSQMRIPSQPGQTILGDRGENLSSVVLAIWRGDALRREAVLEWVRKLTPMDVEDFKFEPDAAGRILLMIKEKSGRIVSATSASDGTLRFLAILAALFGPTPASFYFIEELENGIHPTRLGLLVELIESQTKRRGIQVVATSHSPQLLQFLSQESLQHASLVYRLPDHPEARIKRIVDIPDAQRVIKEQPVSVLHASSWFEDVLDFAEGGETEPVAEGQPDS